MKLTQTNINDSLKRKVVVAETPSKLTKIIHEECLRAGNDVDLNFIDVSNITDFGYMFMLVKHCGFDISQWNVSNAVQMRRMFYRTEFSDTFYIGDWDVSEVTNMNGMFMMSNFNGDISKWKVGKVEDMSNMFMNTSFNKDISGWNVGKVRYFDGMFAGNHAFSHNISKWDLTSAVSMTGMLYRSNIKKEDVSEWTDSIERKRFGFDEVFLNNVSKIVGDSELSLATNM